MLKHVFAQDTSPLGQELLVLLDLGYISSSVTKN